MLVNKYQITMKKTFTLMEVIVGALILAGVFGGLLAAFVGARKYIARAEVRLTAANLARGVFESLYNEVRADLWDETYANGNRLDPSTCILTNPCDAGAVSIGSLTYQRKYAVIDKAPGNDYREVQVTITFSIPQ